MSKAEVVRKRLGLLIPSSNTMMEVDLYRNLPSHITVHTARMYMEDTTPEAESAMLDQYARPAARDVATTKPDAIVFGCTSAGALRGNAYDLEFCQGLQEETGVPVISTIASVRNAIQSRNVERVAVVTPYIDSLNEKIKISVEEDGVEVIGIAGLGMTENVKIADVTPEEIARFSEEQFGQEKFDLLFVSCTNFAGVAAIPLLEERFGVPIVTSNQAVLEAVLAALDSSD